MKKNENLNTLTKGEVHIEILGLPNSVIGHPNRFGPPEVVLTFSVNMKPIEDMVHEGNNFLGYSWETKSPLGHVLWLWS